MDEVAGIILGIAIVYVNIVWIWAMVTLSAYLKPGKSIAFFFSPLWLIDSNIYTDEGKPYLRKARIHFGIPTTLFFLAVFYFIVLSK